MFFSHMIKANGCLSYSRRVIKRAKRHLRKGNELIGVYNTGPLVTSKRVATGKLWIFYKSRGEFRWKLVSANGRIILSSSEGYSNLRAAALNAATSGGYYGPVSLTDARKEWRSL